MTDNTYPWLAAGKTVAVVPDRGDRVEFVQIERITPSGAYAVLVDGRKFRTTGSCYEAGVARAQLADPADSFAVNSYARSVLSALAYELSRADRDVDRSRRTAADVLGVLDDMAAVVDAARKRITKRL